MWTIFIQITTVIFPLSHIPLITFSPVNKFPVFCLFVCFSFFLFFNLHSFQYASPWFSLDVWSDLPPYYLVMKFLYCSPLLGQMISGCPISSYLFYCIFLNYLICHLFWIKGCKESLVTSIYSLYSALRLKFRLVILYRKKSDNNWAYGGTWLHQVGKGGGVSSLYHPWFYSYIPLVQCTVYLVPFQSSAE